MEQSSKFVSSQADLKQLYFSFFLSTLFNC
jgi:hypothetical protein